MCFCAVFGSLFDPFEGHAETYFRQRALAKRKGRYAGYIVNAWNLTYFVNLGVTSMAYLAALGVGLFPIQVFVSVWGSLGVDFGAFFDQVAGLFFTCFFASFFEALGGPKRGTPPSELYPAFGNWGGLGPPLLVSKIRSTKYLRC